MSRYESKVWTNDSPSFVEKHSELILSVIIVSLGFVIGIAIGIMTGV